MTQSYTPLTPPEVEAKLRACTREMLDAERELRAARDVETDCEIAYRKAHTTAMLSGDCPRVTRGEVTVADRDAWVDERCHGEWRALRLATAGREIAADRIRVTRDITSAVQTIAQMVRQAYSVVGA